MAMKRVIDGDRILFIDAKDATKSQCFLDRRGAVVWPRQKEPGIVMVAGLLEEKHDSGRWPLVVLFEDSRDSVSGCMRLMSAKGNFYRISLWLGDLESVRNSVEYGTYLKRFNPKRTGILDAADFPGIAETIDAVDDMGKNGLLRLHRETDAARQLSMADDSGKLDDAAFPAALALCMIVNSYLIYPARTKKMRPKPSKKTGEGYR